MGCVNATAIDWSQSHCGVMLCDVDHTLELMPEVEPILADLYPIRSAFWSDKLVDVKVHMLMPGQFPCIPNWHRDFMPRDENGDHVKVPPTDDLMYAWLSGPPCTEYIDRGKRKFWKPQEWHRFTQATVHRGTVSEEHTWRCFVRVIPAKFLHPGTKNVGTLRRHTQVYLDAGKFTW